MRSVRNPAFVIRQNLKTTHLSYFELKYACLEYFILFSLEIHYVGSSQKNILAEILQQWVSVIPRVMVCQFLQICQESSVRTYIYIASIAEVKDQQADCPPSLWSKPLSSTAFGGKGSTSGLSSLSFWRNWSKPLSSAAFYTREREKISSSKNSNRKVIPE
jgi:hypothetical protein